MKKPLYVIDVDNTVANNLHREPLISRDRAGGADWDAFFDQKLMMADTPIESAARHFREGRFIHGDHIFLTARPEFTRDATRLWLLMHGFATFSTTVLMKPDEIRLLSSTIFKPAVLGTLARYGYRNHTPILIDDYGAVRDAVREAGFTALHAPDCWDDWEAYLEGRGRP
jgi:hypothetical protein